MADDITASGKYLLISVPEFAKDPVGPRAGQPMTSFLRLGAFHEHPENEEATARALALAQHALVVSTGQGGPMGGAYGREVPNGTGVEGHGVFLDDQRVGDPPTGPEDADATSIPQSERMAQSAALLTRGGWWDHSDGNRISTTWGDKVEVIRGAYKMVVMSRQDDPGKGGGWDLSGGHIQDLGPNSMPGASVRLEFRTRMFGQRGTWHLENTTNNFIQTSDYAGDFFEHWFGEKKHSTVGSSAWKPGDDEWSGKLGKPGGNPHIVERTWARKIESYTGTADQRIPEIIEETHAKKQSSLTDVTGEISETTLSNTRISSKTGSAPRPVPFIHEETWAAATTTVTGVAGIAVETTNTTTQLNTTLAGAIVDITIAAAMEEVAVHAHHGSLEVAGMANEFFLGIAKTSVTVAPAQLDVSIGFAKEIKYPDKEDGDITKLKASLKRIDAMMESEFASLTDKHLALGMAFEGLVVHVGPGAPPPPPAPPLTPPMTVLA